MEYALMVLAGCSGFTVAGVCYSCNMRGFNFYGSLEDYKKSVKMRARDTDEMMDYPEGFTPNAIVGFTPGASVPKTPQAPKMNPKVKGSRRMEDPSTIRKMEDRLRTVNARTKEITNDPNFYAPGVMPALGSESNKLQEGIAAAKKARMKKNK